VGEIAKEQAFFQGSCCAKHPGWIQFQGRHSADPRVSQAGTHLTSHQNLRHTLCALTPCSCTAVDSTDFTSVLTSPHRPATACAACAVTTAGLILSAAAVVMDAV
jgi:hypothetical protein